MKRTPTNDDFFLEIDSEIKAYLLGFFLADGYLRLNARCTNSYQLGITLTEEDGYVIKWFHENICPFRTVNYSNQQSENVKYRKPTYNIVWTSTKMANYFRDKYNIIHRKTYDLDFRFPFETIPEKFKWDFIRGFFDGDGQVSYNDQTHSNTFALYTTSKPFAEQLVSFFENNISCKIEGRIEGTCKSHMILYCVRFTSFYKRNEFFKELYEKFYSHKHYFLSRKELKFRKYLEYKFRANLAEIQTLLDSVERRE